MPDTPRNTSVDLIRTAALIGICVVNLPFLGLTSDVLLQMPLNAADRFAADLLQALFEGKFFLLFSFLFGWGIEVQMRSASRAAQDFAPRYLRRLAGLALFGVLHAVLVFTGDILVLYALLGLLAWPLRQACARRLVKVALAMIPVALLALLLLAMLLGGGLPEPESHGMANSFAEATALRAAEWPWTFVFLLLFQGPLAFGAILIGLAAAKTDFFRPQSPGRLWLGRAFPMLLGLGAILNVMTALAPVDEGLLALLGFLLFAIAAPLLSGAYLHLLLTLGDRLTLPAVLTLAGQNSLTAYILQGVLAGFVFGTQGFGLFGQLGQAALLPLAVVLGLLAMALTGMVAWWWGKGPFEALLRRITYGSSAR